ncbi:hypothetical protein HDE68_002646 [Pedobacter cryoconitis]|uniref:Phage protein D n=1 Tax=Pedobacter cryoconitis TaxID=188932 RepID=A0A7W9E0L9_9SPHI|nr:hypothetical protein [Pedobacter cryoconitis]MBB5636745.1 hypothetical protein [Pedobacter cryoconitis]
MLRLCSKTTITQSDGEKLSWEFDALVNCSIQTDVTTLTDTCELELPKKISWEGSKNKSGLPIKKGDKITIRLGYDDELKLRFSGLIKSIDTKNPIKIRCEDGMYILKQKKPEPKAFKSAKLKDVMKHLLQGTDFDFKLIDDELNIGNYRVCKSTVSEELQELKEKYMLTAYFRNIDGKSILYVGLTYPFDNRNKVKFINGKNIIGETFEYRDNSEVKAKVVAVSFNEKHVETRVEIGDKEVGEIIQIRIDGLTEPELRKYAQQSLDTYKEDGLKGSFEAFGEPLVNTCDMIEIYPAEGAGGTYLVKKNEIKFGISGYRQKIELGQPININKTKA